MLIMRYLSKKPKYLKVVEHRSKLFWEQLSTLCRCQQARDIYMTAHNRQKHKHLPEIF